MFGSVFQSILPWRQYQPLVPSWFLAVVDGLSDCVRSLTGTGLKSCILAQRSADWLGLRGGRSYVGAWYLFLWVWSAPQTAPEVVILASWPWIFSILTRKTSRQHSCQTRGFCLNRTNNGYTSVSAGNESIAQCMGSSSLRALNPLWQQWRWCKLPSSKRDGWDCSALRWGKHEDIMSARHSSNRHCCSKILISHAWIPSVGTKWTIMQCYFYVVLHKMCWHFILITFI